MTDTIKCIECGADIVIDKPTERQLKAALIKTKFCPDCLRKHKYASVKSYQSAKRSEKQKKQKVIEDHSLPTFEEVERGYRKFWAKRGIDIDKYTEWGSL